MKTPVLLLFLLLLGACRPATGPSCEDVPPAPEASAAATYVVHVSVDGLRSDAVERHLNALPTFARLRAEGAWTSNARTDVDFQNTLPNHTGQLTGRPVRGKWGHGWDENTDPKSGETLHGAHGAYVASVFDVAHDRGLSTAAYVSKTKFVLFSQSYDDAHGAADTTGGDDGRDKLDVFVLDEDTRSLSLRMDQELGTQPARYTFLHLRDPDSAGHEFGWDVTDGSPYMRAVTRVDSLLGDLLQTIESSPVLAGRTTVIVTADHGGVGKSHHQDSPAAYTVPFFVWGAGTDPADLYRLNASTRRTPGDEQLSWGSAVPPIRNGEAGNVALRLLGLPAIPCSSIGTPASLVTALPDADAQIARR